MKQSRVWAEIDLDAITQNLRRIREIVGEDRGIMAIVKANAYGHGAVPVAWHLATCGVNAVGVGDSQEAIELRRAGLSIPILILGAVVPGELPDVVAHDIAKGVLAAGDRVGGGIIIAEKGRKMWKNRRFLSCCCSCSNLLKPWDILPCKRGGITRE